MYALSILQDSYKIVHYPVRVLSKCLQGNRTADSLVAKSNSVCFIHYPVIFEDLKSKNLAKELSRICCK